MDLHLHTPASADWMEPGVTYLEWLQKAESRGLDIVAITDHNTVEGIAKLRADIERLAWLEANDRLRPQERRDLDEYRRLGDKILVLPGFEFTAMFGFHILALFPPETPLRKLELLLMRLNVPVDRLTEGITEVGASTDVLTVYRLINEAGGIVIAAHANSTHGVALQGLSFGGQTKIAFTQDPNLHALEVTDLESTSRRATAHFFDGSKPEYPRRMHCIQGSDAHRLSRDPRDKNRLGVGERVTEVLLPEISFEALKAVFVGDDFTRTRPYRPPAEVPFDHVEAAREQGNTIIQAFHESLSREGGRLYKVLCDVVAFANTSGGAVYIGASAARKTPPKGVENPEPTVVQLRREIERSITPPLDVRVDAIQSLGVPIVRVTVPNGPDKPYAMNQTRVYVRQEGETNEAVRDELVQLVLAGQAVVGETSAPAPLPAAAPTAELVSQAQATPVVVKPAPVVVTPTPVPLPAPVPARTALPAPVEGLPLPSVGVEIVAMEERKGARYFTIRDLRNSNTVQNVTMQSARKLWSYAISQHLANPVDPDRVAWRGSLGLWQSARRAKKLRYDLAVRQPDGTVRAFYGVTADGMTGPWAQFLQAEDRGEGESALIAEIAPELGAEWEASLAIMEEIDYGREGEPAVSAPTVIETVAEEIPVKAKRRSRRPRGKAAAEAAETQPAENVSALAGEPLLEAAAIAEPELPAATEPAPATSGRRRRAKAQAQPEAPAAETQPESAAQPASRPRRARAQAQPEAPVAETAASAMTPPAAASVLAESASQPKPRSRSRKPKTPPSNETPGVSLP